jgi:hypothetical protein
MQKNICNDSSLFNHGATMKLNERLRHMLTAIAQSPRRASYFTHGDYNAPLNPGVLQGWLDKLTSAGYCFEAESAFHITARGRKALDQKDVAQLRKHIGTGTYRSDLDQYYRPGSDHSHIKSRGDRC